MIDKEFVLVSQGMEIMRTKSQENAINYIKKENDKWFNYVQRCVDNYEDYADNYIDLEIEYSSEKEKDKEIERLKEEYMILQNASDEVEEELQQRINKAIEYIEDNTYKSNETEYMDLTGIKELSSILKGVDKE